MKRVYHPGLDSWRDVPDDAVTEWTEAGWLTKRPKHVDDSAAPLAESPAVPVPVVDNTPTHVPETPIVDNTPTRRAATTKG